MVNVTEIHHVWTNRTIAVTHVTIALGGKAPIRTISVLLNHQKAIHIWNNDEANFAHPKIRRYLAISKARIPKG